MAVYARLWHGAIALAVLAGLVVQIILVATLSSRPHNATAGVIAGATMYGRYVRTASFFTIQSNILAGLTSAQLAFNPNRDGRAWRVLRLDALTGITVTGIIYTTVLARVHEPKGWEQVTTNTLFHYVTPIAVVVGFILFGPRPRVDRAVVLWSLIWPATWFAYTVIRGTVDSWYPYPFVDVITHGYARVLLNAALATVVLGVVGVLYWLGDRRLPLGDSLLSRIGSSRSPTSQELSASSPGDPDPSPDRSIAALPGRSTRTPGYRRRHNLERN